MKTAVVTGAGGFIGWHLTRRLKSEGYFVRGVDIKHPEFAPSEADDFQLLDLRVPEYAERAVNGMEEVYALAANMGGMGWIQNHHAEILRDNTAISLNTLEAAYQAGAERYFYASSVCIYPQHLQDGINAPHISERDAIPADPMDAYGWEKLHTEILCDHYARDFGMITRVARFHNCYGTYGTYTGERAKAPAALCRKIATAVLTGNHEIEIWGDGLQIREFVYVDDLVNGVRMLMDSDYDKPLNIGTGELVSINALAHIIASIAGIDITLKHVTGAQGVRARHIDSTLIRDVLDWKPSYTLEAGLRKTYTWVEKQVATDLEKV